MGMAASLQGGNVTMFSSFLIQNTWADSLPVLPLHIINHICFSDFKKHTFFLQGKLINQVKKKKHC